MIQAFGFAALTASAAPAFSMAKAKVPEIKKVYNIYCTVEEMKRDTTIKEGTIVRTAGYYIIGDGGEAEFIIKNSKSDEEGTVAISNNLYASLINVKIRLTGSDSGLMRGALTFNNCKFEPVAKNNGKSFYLLGAELGTSFINCILYAPHVGNVSKPELIDQVGFIQVNKAVHYNHINTRLGNDILNYYKSKGLKINSNFIAMLKSHHEMESAII